MLSLWIWGSNDAKGGERGIQTNIKVIFRAEPLKCSLKLVLAASNINGMFLFLSKLTEVLHITVLLQKLCFATNLRILPLHKWYHNLFTSVTKMVRNGPFWNECLCLCLFDISGIPIVKGCNSMMWMLLGVCMLLNIHWWSNITYCRYSFVTCLWFWIKTHSNIRMPSHALLSVRCKTSVWKAQQYLTFILSY